ARIERMSPEADAASRTVTVYAVVEQDPFGDMSTLLLPGQFVRGALSSSEAEDAVLVPRVAVRDDRVMVVDAEGRASERRVRVEFFLRGERPGVAPDERDWAVVSEGLAEGERVVISNLDDLRPGAAVHAVD